MHGCIQRIMHPSVFCAYIFTTISYLVMPAVAVFFRTMVGRLLTSSSRVRIPKHFLRSETPHEIPVARLSDGDNRMPLANMLHEIRRPASVSGCGFQFILSRLV